MGAPEFERVTVIGVGLIGGSLALDARDAGLFGRIIGCGRTVENLERAKRAGIVDEYNTDPAGAVRDADLVLLCIPVLSFEAVARTIAPVLKEGVVVTDVGSVKGELVEGLEKALGSRARFVAGHPVAGSEKIGAAAAVRGLFKNRRCILTPSPETDPDALKQVQLLWETVGMKVVQMEPFYHDRIMAAISHLPHLVVYALVETIIRLKEKDPQLLDYAAGGFHDFTRIAASSPEMWRDIFHMNSENVLQTLGEFERVLTRLREMIDNGDWESMSELFERSRLVKTTQ